MAARESSHQRETKAIRHKKRYRVEPLEKDKTQGEAALPLIEVRITQRALLPLGRRLPKRGKNSVMKDDCK